MKKEQGFSLIELLIVVAIIAIIAAIAVPSMLTSRMAANEASAVEGVRTIGSAQVAFAAVNNQAYTDIQTLVTQTFLDQRYDPTSPGFNGYIYTDSTNIVGAPAAAYAAAPDGFGALADPITADSTGRYEYGIAADQVVRFQKVSGAATAPLGLTAGDPIGKAASSGS
jgi:type IV pilus assembly protein PilA